MQVIDEDQYTHAVYYGAGRYTMTRKEMGTRYGSLVIRILADPQDQEDMKQVHALQDAICVIHQPAIAAFDPQGLCTMSANCRYRMISWKN